MATRLLLRDSPVTGVPSVLVALLFIGLRVGFKSACEEFLRDTGQANQHSGLVILSPGPAHEDMANEWPDVTAEFLKE